MLFFNLLVFSVIRHFLTKLFKIENPIESVKDETIDYNVDHAYLLEKDNYENFIINDSFVRNGGFEHSSDSLYWDIADWSVSQGSL